jgi:hypothetical protein
MCDIEAVVRIAPLRLRRLSSLGDRRQAGHRDLSADAAGERANVEDAAWLTNALSTGRKWLLGE